VVCCLLANVASATAPAGPADPAHAPSPRQFLAYCGQFVRSMVDSCFMKEAKVTALPIEALNVLLMLEQFCRFAQIPRSVLTGFVPDYIYDAIDIDSAQPVSQ